MSSNNMHYYYNVEYYDNLRMELSKENGKDICKFSVNNMNERSKRIIKFSFLGHDVFNLPDEEAGIKSFELYSAYPGVMIGIGNPHSIKIEGAMQNGFTFDYVTGIPYLPGSSLKGILKSAFPGKKFPKAKEQYIKSYLEEGKNQVNIKKLADYIFGSDDTTTPGKGVFYGVFPDVENADKQQLLTDDYITPHKDEFTSPIPIRMVKIRPDIKLIFKFSCDTYKEDDISITSDDMCNLFKKIILDIGIGAKTNVGYGVMVEDNKYLKTDVSSLNEGTDKTVRTPAPNKNNKNNNSNNNKRMNKGNEKREYNVPARK